MSIEERVAALDQREFDMIAGFAARQLADRGAAWVDLQPGDMTTYKIVIVQPVWIRWADERLDPVDRYWVATSFGPLYEWNPQMSPYDYGYVMQKWVSGRDGTAEHTARVICRFLNTLAEKMKET